jgi:DNA-binding transcriptional LysR family regulator
MKVELRHLRAVIAVAQHRHFSEAARSLHTSQPNLSRLIRNIEDELDARLFDRHTRGVALTPFGREFVRHASSVLDLHASGMADLSDLIEMRRGHVTVAALPSISTSLLADVLHAFRAAHPAIDISIRDDVTASIIGLVREARVDFGIGLAAGDMNELDTQPLATDNLMLLCHRDHRLAARETCRWSDLRDESVIAFAAGSSVRPLMERAYAENGMAFRPAIEASHLSSAEGMALKGLGVAIVPSTRALTITDPSLRAMPIRDPVMTRELVLIHRQGRSLSPAAQVLRDMVAEFAARERRLASV